MPENEFYVVHAYFFGTSKVIVSTASILLTWLYLLVHCASIWEVGEITFLVIASTS